MTQSRRRLPLSARRQYDETATAVIDDCSIADLREKIGDGRDQIALAIVEDISPDGVAKVLVNGETQTHEASSLVTFPSADAAAEALLGRAVLVLLNPPAQPVILGAVAQRLWARTADVGEQVTTTSPQSSPRSVQIDKRRIDLEADDEIRLTCGKSSLLLRRDGTVIVRGVKIVSRALQSNKIRGGTVSVN